MRWLESLFVKWPCVIFQLMMLLLLHRATKARDGPQAQEFEIIYYEPKLSTMTNLDIQNDPKWPMTS